MNTSRDALTGLTGRWSLILATTVVGALMGLLYAVVVPPTYTAHSYVLITNASDPSNTEGATNFAQAYGRVIADPGLLERSSPAVGASVQDLLDKVRASTSPDAPLIDIAVTDRTAGRSADIANTVAIRFLEFANTRTADTAMRVSIFNPAAPPPQPSTPVLRLDVVVGAAVGLLLGALAAASGVAWPASVRRPTWTWRTRRAKREIDRGRAPSAD